METNCKRRQSARLFTVAIIMAFAAKDTLADDALKTRIDRLAQPYIDAEVVAGMTIGVLRNGETTIVGYGRLEDSDARQPDGDTVYEIGSISKVFTGVLLGDAVSRGRVRLDQPLQELLPPQVVMPKQGKRIITLQDLATHVSGLPTLPDNFQPADNANPYADYSADRLYAFLGRYKPDRAPGIKYEYSNLAGGLLGHVLSVDADKTYEQLLKERVLAPLEMSDTTVALSAAHRSRLAEPHLSDGALTNNWNFEALAGAGAIRSTTKDMLRFVQANLEPDSDETGSAIKLAWKVHQEPLETGGVALGLGWHIAQDIETRWHNGQTGGYHSMMLVNRDIKTGVVVLANTASMEVDRLAQDIITMCAGAAVEPRVFSKSVAVDDKVMRQYVGKYQLVPGFVLTVSVDDGKLMVAATGQPTFQVFARSDREWFYKVVDATLTFAVDKDGKCSSVELFQNGVRQKASRID